MSLAEDIAALERINANAAKEGVCMQGVPSERCPCAVKPWRRCRCCIAASALNDIADAVRKAQEDLANADKCYEAHASGERFSMT